MGTRGPSKTPKTTVKFAVSVPPPPDWLDEVARAEYERVAKLMEEAGNDYLQMVDLSVLATYSQAYSDVRRLTIETREEGEVLVSEKKGTAYMNPKFAVLSACRNSLAESARRLAFSPADRARLSGKMPKTRGDKYDPLAEFIG